MSNQREPPRRRLSRHSPHTFVSVMIYPWPLAMAARLIRGLLK